MKLPAGSKEIQILSLSISEIERYKENLSLANSPESLFIPRLFTSISFNHDFFISVYSLLYSSYIQLHFLLSLCQSKFTPISFNPVFSISGCSLLYSSYIHLYLFLSLVYPPVSLSISLFIQIHAYLFQSHFLYLCLFFKCPPLFVSISCLSTSISFYLFVNPNSRLSLSIPFSISLSVLRMSTYIFFYLLSLNLYLFQISLLIQIHACLFQSPFSLCLSILSISTYICFYLLSIRLYLFLSLC